MGIYNKMSNISTKTKLRDIYKMFGFIAINTNSLK